jgi:hypothetical protein
MTLRSTRETIDDLRQLYKDLEHPRADWDPESLNSLRQIVFNRIATLEATEELEARGARLVSETYR